MEPLAEVPAAAAAAANTQHFLLLVVSSRVVLKSRTYRSTVPLTSVAPLERLDWSEIFPTRIHSVDDRNGQMHGRIGMLAGALLLQESERKHQVMERRQSVLHRSLLRLRGRLSLHADCRVRTHMPGQQVCCSQQHSVFLAIIQERDGYPNPTDWRNNVGGGIIKPKALYRRKNTPHIARTRFLESSRIFVLKRSLLTPID
jgi:hypothetical protein